MTDFEGAALRKELSQEPIDNAETRQLLERLTAADLGDHMPTLGAVAEATGHSVEDVAAQLVAIRADNDPHLRRRVERLESVVLDHEIRLDAPPTNRSKPIVGPYGREHFFRASDNTGLVLTIGIVGVIILILVAAISTTSTPSRSEPSCYAAGNPVPCEFVGPSR